MKKKVVRKGFIVNEETRKKISACQLEIGMFISELDQPWIETPFLMQGFMVETQEHIDLVRELCEYIYIDQVQQRYVPPEERVISTTKSSSRYIHKVSVETECAVAGNVYQEARRLTKSMMDDVSLGNAFDAEHAKQTVSECVDSILRNPDALMWLGKIRNVNSHVADHSLNVAILAVTFGRFLDMNTEDLNNLGLCGLVHDIGKMKVPTEILKKETRYTEHEEQILKNHPLHGRNILMANRSLFNGATDVAHCHHERIDGTGYPRGLNEVGISTFTRIVAIVDTYDTITMGTPNSAPESTLSAMRHLYSLRGKHFDDKLVLQFIQCIGLYPPGSIVELKNGEVGIVISTNLKNRRLPKILLQLDQDKRPQKPRIINLGIEEQQGPNQEYLILDMLVNGAHNIDIRQHLKEGLVFS